MRGATQGGENRWDSQIGCLWGNCRMTALRNRDPEPEYPALSWRGLGLSWAVLLATVVAGGSLLQTLGPPRDALAGRSGDRPPLAQASIGATAAPAQALPSANQPA